MSRNIQDIQFDCANIKLRSEERHVKKTANIRLSILVQTWAQTFFKIGEQVKSWYSYLFHFNKR